VRAISGPAWPPWLGARGGARNRLRAISGPAGGGASADGGTHASGAAGVRAMQAALVSRDGHLCLAKGAHSAPADKPSRHELLG